MKSLFLSIVFLALLPVVSRSQEGVAEPRQDPPKKNSIFGNVGLVPPLWAASASLSYDRSVYIAKDGTDIRAKFSIGYIGILMAGSYNYQSLAAGMLSGRRNHHFELYGGAALNQYNKPGGPVEDGSRDRSQVGVFPVGNLGYRFQKPGGGFIFRAGVGVPDLCYVGVGFAF